jgi:hypothetical protein
MANKYTEGKRHYISLSRGEALEIIALLSSHLAGEGIRGLSVGGCPSIDITDKGHTVETLIFALAPKETQSE